MLCAVVLVLVIFSRGRVSADHQKVFRCSQSLVPGACRQDTDIAGDEEQRTAIFAAETNARASWRDTEHFMSARVIMHVIVNAIAPCIDPTVCLE